jgi:hypothetical protein
MGSDNFSSTVDLLKGYNVNLYVGEEIIKGKLMGVESDHIILEDEKKYVYYYSIDKIQAITKNTKQFKGEEITTEFMKTQSLADLLSSLKNSWVSILCLNKQSFSGVLSIVDTDFVTLINGEDRILIKISHISNILKGYRKEEKQEETKNETETEAAVSESKAEVAEDDNYIETQVFMKEEKQESVNVQQVVNLVDKEVLGSPKVIVNQPENEKKVWAEPIKSSSPIVKISNEIKKEEKKQSVHHESIPQSVKQSTDSKWVKTELPKTQQEDVKKQKSEVVIQNIVKHDKENLQKAAAPSMDKRVQVKPVREQLKVEPQMKKEVPASSTQELLNKVKLVKQTIDTDPLMKIEKTKMHTVESKKEDKKPKAQEVGASRFSGEPAKRDFDRRSIFSGWPNRNNSLRRI